jgi:kojibiose phosphorylase
MACKVGRIEDAYEHFSRSAFADLYDVRGNASDGIHGASAGGLWQAVVFGFAGVHLEDGGFAVHPRLPDAWRRLAFTFSFHGKRYFVDIARQNQGYAVYVNER